MEKLDYKGYAGSIEYIKAVMYAESHGTSIDAFVNDLIERKLEAVS